MMEPILEPTKYGFHWVPKSFIHREGNCGGEVSSGTYKVVWNLIRGYLSCLIVVSQTSALYSSLKLTHASWIYYTQSWKYESGKFFTSILPDLMLRIAMIVSDLESQSGLRMFPQWEMDSSLRSDVLWPQVRPFQTLTSTDLHSPPPQEQSTPMPFSPSKWWTLLLDFQGLRPGAISGLHGVEFPVLTYWTWHNITWQDLFNANLQIHFCSISRILSKKNIHLLYDMTLATGTQGPVSSVRLRNLLGIWDVPIGNTFPGFYFFWAAVNCRPTAATQFWSQSDCAWSPFS